MSALVDQARLAFGSYAALDAPELPPEPWSALQVRLCRWQVAQFGVQPDERQALGISEEVGELVEARWRGDQDAVRDAFADVMVFATQLCTGQRLDLGTIWRWVEHEQSEYHFMPVESKLAIAAGRLCHVVLKTSQRIRGFADPDFAREKFTLALGQLLIALHLVAKGGDFNPERAYFDVAEHVMTRKWKADPTSAGGAA